MSEPWLSTFNDWTQAARSSAHTPPTFVVACDPLQAVSESHFSSNKISENSNLVRKTQMDSAATILAISSANIIYVSLGYQVKHFPDLGLSTFILLTRKDPEAQAVTGFARAVVTWARSRGEGHSLAVFFSMPHLISLSALFLARGLCA